MHRPQAAVDVAAFDELAKHRDDPGFVVGCHRQVRAVPVAEHAEALEFLALDGDELLRVGAAPAADVELRQLAQLAAEILRDLVLDRHAVAVPTGDVRRQEARHGLRLHHDVLDDLVEPGAEVHVPVGVRRAIVQHVLRFAGIGVQNLLVEVGLAPACHDGRLTLRQIGAHREVSFGEIQCVLVIHAGGVCGRFF
jgi:hypothetical protein